MSSACTIECSSSRTTEDADRLDIIRVDVRDTFTLRLRRVAAVRLTTVGVDDGYPVDDVEGLVALVHRLRTTHDDTRSTTETRGRGVDVYPCDLTVEAIHEVGILHRRKSVALDFLDIIAQGLLRALDTESGDDNGFHLIVFSGELDLELSLVTDRDLDLLVADGRYYEDRTCLHVLQAELPVDVRGSTLALYALDQDRSPDHRLMISGVEDDPADTLTLRHRGSDRKEEDHEDR